MNIPLYIIVARIVGEDHPEKIFTPIEVTMDATVQAMLENEELDLRYHDVKVMNRVLHGFTYQIAEKALNWLRKVDHDNFREYQVIEVGEKTI